MNSDSGQAWSSMVHDNENEFSNFLDFNDINIDFPAFDTTDQQQNQQQQQQAHDQHDGTQAPSTEQMLVTGGPDTEMGGSGGLGGHEQIMMNGGAGPMDIQFPGHGTKSMADMEHQARIQQQHQQHQQQQYYQHHAFPRQGVPPTPSSLEMHGGHHFSGVNPHQARAFYEAYARKQQEQMFTPLVSPAVTPLDTQFNQMPELPEYARPGEYFSPLTSPALQAQQHARSAYSSIKDSDTSEAPSPVDMDLDSPGKAAVSGPAATSTTTKGKRKPASKLGSRAVRQSPAMKPQRKKQSSSTTIPARDIADIMEGFTDSHNQNSSPARPGSEKLSVPVSKTPSETGSISPEPLSEVLMPPPATPRPGTAGRSPNLGPRDNAPRSAPMKPLDNPATPASLMKLQKGKQPVNNARMSQTAASAGASDITIPSPSISANGREKPDLSLDTGMVLDDDQATPTLHARNGSSSAPLTALTPGIMSPSFNGLASPNGRSGAAGSRSIVPGSKGKKRNSSSHASPALRPKISPSIKPLLPEGAKITPETSALLLASKSNYQNILEGTHLPGVSYPEALSENLTSKRTSHKIAEQGRRNRINTALQEIAELLPKTYLSPTLSAKDSASGSKSPAVGPTNGTGSDKSGAKGKKERQNSVNASASSSKANTVEMAIEYIKALQGELKEVKGRLEVAERKLGEKGESADLGEPALTLLPPAATTTTTSKSPAGAVSTANSATNESAEVADTTEEHDTSKATDEEVVEKEREESEEVQMVA